MSDVDAYRDLAQRPNTRRSYEVALRHFEQEWRGLLPATPDTIARYLAEYAAAASVATLRLRLSALSRWHHDHGFADPTKATIVSQVLKGIRAAHAAPQKQARPLELLELQQVSDWLAQEPTALPPENIDHVRLRHARDQAMLLIGFWRGFRSDELTRLAIEHVTVEPGVGMTLYLPQSKGDHEFAGRSFWCPALSRLCPVTAYERWIALSGLSSGPVFRGIDRWGLVGTDAMAPGSLIPWLRRLLQAAGLTAPERYSSHSLRRGFAGWARASSWDMKELMEYVGWKDIKSAIRYLDVSNDDLSARFERGLSGSPDVPEKSGLVLPDETTGDPRRSTKQPPSLKVVK